MAESGRLALRLDPAQQVSYSALELKKGAWRVKMHGSGPEPVLSLETPDRRLRREVKGGQFHLGSRGPWIIRLQAEASVALYEIELIFEPR
jgi:nitrogen fixation protein FixH